jgi:hypothetical protein
MHVKCIHNFCSLLGHILSYLIRSKLRQVSYEIHSESLVFADFFPNITRGKV